MPHRDIRTTK